MEVWWPASNTRQTFSNVGKNQFVELREGDKALAKVDRKPFHLGGAKPH
jgi:hypothetical protein